MVDLARARENRLCIITAEFMSVFRPVKDVFRGQSEAHSGSNLLQQMSMVGMRPEGRSISVLILVAGLIRLPQNPSINPWTRRIII